MNDAGRGPRVEAYWESQLANILGRHDPKMWAAVDVGNRSAIDTLVREVLAALEAEVTDLSADYHAYYHEPLPNLHDIEAAIRAHAATRGVTGRGEG